MKIFHWILLFTFLFISNAFSQDSIAKDVNITNIPNEGLLLNNGWKFQAGDNPEWARNDYNDSSWSTINPTKDIYDLPENSKKGICWLRLHIYSGNDIDKQFSIFLQQSGASEIYLDDRLIYVFGVISKNTAEIKGYDPLWKPFRLPMLKEGNHVLAVRYKMQPGIFYTNAFETINPLLWIKVMEANKAVIYYQKRSALTQATAFISIGFLLMMFVLHMTFYLVYRSQKGNLFFGLYAFASLTGNILQLIFIMFNHTVEYKFYIGQIALVLFFSTSLFILIALKYILELRWGFSFWASMILFVMAAIISVSVYPWGWRAGAIVTPFVYLNIIVIAVRSVLKRKRGAWIIAMGAISSILFFTAFFLTVHVPGKSLFERYDIFNSIIFMLFALSLPISASLVLALDFAFANKSLQVKLTEVSELSQKNIMQEREKQQLLSSQNDMLEKQVAVRTSELEQSLENLRSTQEQLIQSGKMASLGELTAGIAHEIQNPLNFINNFSEINKELLAEMKDEMDSGNTMNAKAVANDIMENEEKINHHGKRADAIVKGMLQHSRSGTGIKEPVDINSLADEYLRLSYHGFRAKEKDFHASIKTDFDDRIGEINVIPQDIGRVLLNLYNNAFYAVSERIKQEQESYEAIISVATRKLNGKVEIIVQDNGGGVPQKLKDKIFQPFFTTKPTGQGTGLGLSLSYDIVKAHGGELKVESQVGVGAEFVVLIPVS